MPGNQAQSGKQKRKGFLFAWREAVCGDSGLTSTTRHVLLVLSMHMDIDGGRCFPSIDRIARMAALSKPAACKHLKLAASEGWIFRQKKGESGQAWRKWQYQATFPRNKGGSPELPPSENVVTLSTERGKCHAKNVVTEVYPISSMELSKKAELLKLNEILGLQRGNKESLLEFCSRIERANQNRIDRL